MITRDTKAKVDGVTTALPAGKEVKLDQSQASVLVNLGKAILAGGPAVPVTTQLEHLKDVLIKAISSSEAAADQAEVSAAYVEEVKAEIQALKDKAKADEIKAAEDAEEKAEADEKAVKVNIDTSAKVKEALDEMSAMDEKEIDKLALEKYGIKLDGRRKKKTMLKTFKAAYAEKIMVDKAAADAETAGE